jgi:hypothetical protein
MRIIEVRIEREAHSLARLAEYSNVQQLCDTWRDASSSIENVTDIGQ